MHQLQELLGSRLVRRLLDNRFVRDVLDSEPARRLMLATGLDETQLLLGSVILATILLTLLGWGLLRRGRRRPGHAAAEPTASRARPIEEAPPAPSPAARLRAALAKTREGFWRRVAAQAPGGSTDDRLEGFEEALLVADVGMQTTQSLLGRLRERATSTTSPAELMRILAADLRAVLPEGHAGAELARAPEGPTVLLVVGVNGVGKTTTIGKLAARHIENGRRVLLVAGDTFRAAAAEQLERWGERVGAEVIRQQSGADPAAVVVDGLRAARARDFEIVIIDTAGRLHTRTNLMEELRKVRRVIDRECPGGPHETLLVLDATTGQNGLQQARIFKEAMDVTGVILTKMDGTARGGIAIAVGAELGIPVRFVGLGEKMEDLQPFSPDEFIDALLAPDTESGAGPQAPLSVEAGRPA